MRGDEVSLPLADSLQNSFSLQLALKGGTAAQTATLWLSLEVGILLCLLHHPQVKSELTAKNQIPELEIN